MKKFLILYFILFAGSVLNAKSSGADTIYSTRADVEIFNKYIAYIQEKGNLPTDKLVIETAKFFLGTPYVANTLEIEPEGLVINLRELDCTTFVENVFALTLTVKSGVLLFENYCANLKKIRYRGGVIEDYTSRLHYSTDWIYDNELRGNLKDVTRKAGASRLDLNLYIMSKTPETYKQLKGRPDLVEKIVAKEKEISARKHYFIKAKRINRKWRRIKDGSMVGFVTTIPGIDLSHMAIVYHEGKKLTFIHASSSGKKVMINESSMGEFVLSSKRNTGIVLSALNQ
jgi:hypothetical protein